MSKLPSHLPRPASLLTLRPTLTSSSRTSPAPYNSTTPTPTLTTTQTRAATFVPRVRRPYTFTQLIQLSDGSTYTLRSTSPTPLVRSAKDSRNHALWQPTDKSLQNVEVDEAGKLAAFRQRFGRAFDLAEGPKDAEGGDAVKAGSGKDAAAAKDKDAAAAAAEDDAYDLGDLIGDYGASIDQNKLKSAKTFGKVKGAS
ncbi:54S ribosomal protein L36 [Colletotrichum siamense]|uniref:54S ribosomal protein L36 n=1 Tax=Colletotrichum siamense TaxID=690259 RepID=A0A9P5K4P8_COLSI|nr:54S ribosomal protein L36 [Colletotrichum siamense]KAF4859653.1 54S ribosomal protein L36 [Colletotrichum siamense]